ncbi:hypothetical protein Efla_007456 [Eimeria flavescens]
MARAAAGGPPLHQGAPQGLSGGGAPRGAPRKKTNWLIAFLIGACVGLAIWPLLLSIATLNLLRQWGEGPTTGGPSMAPPPVEPPNQSVPHEPPEEGNKYAFTGMQGSLRGPKALKTCSCSGLCYSGKRSTAAAAAVAAVAAAVRRQQAEGPPLKTQKFKPLRFSDLAGKLLLLLLLLPVCVVGGLTDAKLELQEVVQCLRAPEKFRRLGARLPRGLLLVGPPGTGKTALARAVATEAGVPLLYASGSEFVEVYVGQGARRVRQLFAAARRGAPLILFIDELDAVGGRRGPGGAPGGGREHEQTLNQLLVEMDGFQGGGEGVVVLAATNRVDALDPALLRPGRFDRVVHVPLPDRRAREQILLKYISKVPVEAPPEEGEEEEVTSLQQGIEEGESRGLKRQGSGKHRQKRAPSNGTLAPPEADKTLTTTGSSSNSSSSSSSGKKKKEVEKEGEGSIHKALASQLAKLTPGFSGAELENLVNEAAILAARAADKNYISVAEFLEARDKVTLGPARGSRLQSAYHRRMTATHEAGHAVVAFFLQPSSDPIYKATIVSRGSALGLVEQLPVDDRYGASFAELFARLCVCMAGRAAEKLAFGEDAVSTGASSDIRTATQLAFNMVATWGMSSQLGPLAYSSAARSNFISSETARQVELEVKALVTAAEARASALLRRRWRCVSLLTEALLEKETLSGEEIAALIDPKGSWMREVTRQRQTQLMLAEGSSKPGFWGWLGGAKGPGAHWLGALWSRLKGAFQRRPPNNQGPPKEGPGSGEGEAPKVGPPRNNPPSQAAQQEKGGPTAAATAAADGGAATAQQQRQETDEAASSRYSTCSSSSSSTYTPEHKWGLSGVDPLPSEVNASLQQLRQRLLLQQQQQQQSRGMRPISASLPEEPLAGGLGPQLT